MTKRRALLIGNIHYNHTLYDNLLSVDADLNLMKNTLSLIQYSCIIAKDSTCDRLNEVVNDFLDYEDADENDVNLIYYSGHGKVVDNHLCLVTIEKNSVDYYELEDIVDKISGKRGHFLIILDTCRSGNREYTPIFQDANCYIMYSTDSGKSSYIGNISVFTDCLCRNMLNAGMGVGELFSKTMNDMRGIGNEQVPVAINRSSEDFVIFPIPFEVIKNQDGIQSVFTLKEIEEQIVKQSKYDNMGLDFYQLDDESFALKLELSINDEEIYIVGKSREETLYRILNEIKNKYADKPVFVFYHETQWIKMLSSDIEDCILIPFFYSSNIIKAKERNTNIYIFSESDPCPYKNKILLRKRTLNNLCNSLCNIGIEHQEAIRIVRETNGQYTSLKKYIFSGGIITVSRWKEKLPSSVIFALLCGEWTDSEADQLFIQELCGYSYEQFWMELEPYFNSEDPLVIESITHRGKIKQIAAYEDVWQELNNRIQSTIWDHFDKLFIQTISTKIHTHLPYGDLLLQQKNDKTCSSALIEGIIRTMILRACYSTRAEDQNQVDYIVRELLKNIKDENDWINLSDIIMDLCEASPEQVLSKLEYELTNSNSGLECLFPVEKTTRRYSTDAYLNYLWAAENLLCQKQYAARTVEWLWSLDDSWKPDINKQTVVDLLERVFCLWSNTCALNIQEKVELMAKAAKRHERVWNVLVKELPSSFSTTLELSKPTYRDIDEQNPITIEEYRDCLKQYLVLCISLCWGRADRWVELLNSLEHFESKEIEDVLSILEKQIEEKNDEFRHMIKEKIRRIISNHRHYTDADWFMGEEKLELFEKCLLSININIQEYEYLYLFNAEWDFPLLYPVANDNETNEQLREKEIKEKVDEFEAKGLQINYLISLASEEMNENSSLGEVLARYFCRGNFQQGIFCDLISHRIGTQQIRQYIVTLIRMGEQIDLCEILRLIDYNVENLPYLSTVISCDIITQFDNAIILQQEDTIKEYFWKHERINVTETADEDTCMRLIAECCKYGDLRNAINLLFELHSRIKPINVFEGLKSSLKCKGNPDSMTGYYIKHILKYCRENTTQAILLRTSIAAIEWQCRNLLKWEDMECVQIEIKEDPTLYAAIVNIIYKKEGEKEDPEKQKLAQQFLSAFRKVKFCPGQTNGDVDKKKLQQWADGLKMSLENQNQSYLWAHLMGKLIAYSPIGKDGFEPCEEIREFIEDNGTEEMLSAYIGEIITRRGVFSLSAGDNEQHIAQKYNTIANKFNTVYPKTAQIYYRLRDFYFRESEHDRKQAEDDL